MAQYSLTIRAMNFLGLHSELDPLISAQSGKSRRHTNHNSAPASRPQP